MARKFVKLTKQGLTRLQSGQTLTEHGIEYERLPNGDAVFRANIMVDGQRVHRVLGRASDGMTPQQALAWTSELQIKAAQDRLGIAKGRKTEMAFEEAARRYLEELARTNGKDIEEKRRRLMLHLIPFFGKMPLSKIDSLSVERYKKERRDQPSMRGGVRRGVKAESRPIANQNKLASRATINRELAVLSHLLNRAVEWGWIASKPVKLRRFQEQQARFEYLTAQEIGRLLEAAAVDPHPQIYAFVCIALHTAMRAGEILSLRREFVDLDKLVIHLSKAKTGARDVPISPNLKQFLEHLVQSIALDGPWLFPSALSKSGHTYLSAAVHMPAFCSLHRAPNAVGL